MKAKAISTLAPIPNSGEKGDTNREDPKVPTEAFTFDPSEKGRTAEDRGQTTPLGSNSKI